MMLTAVKGKECMALLDSGSVAYLVLAKFVEGKIDSLPQDTCLCDVVVAFGISLVAILTQGLGLSATQKDEVRVLQETENGLNKIVGSKELMLFEIAKGLRI